MVTKDVTTLEQLHEVGKEVLALCIPKNTATVLALSGDLGAGKTAFTKALGRHLGVVEEITSPTFVIMKSYHIPLHPYFKTLVHIDAYRIEGDDEMRVLGFQDLLRDPTLLICIEWPEKIKNCIPRYAHTISLTLHTNGTRTVEFDT